MTLDNSPEGKGEIDEKKKKSKQKKAKALGPQLDVARCCLFSCSAAAFASLGKENTAGGTVECAEKECLLLNIAV